MKDNILNKIEETKYLCTENTYRYRPIIKVIYENHENMKYWMSKEEIFIQIQRDFNLKDYNLELLKNDLDILVDKKNLDIMQDMSNVTTIEEFKNRKLLYQITEKTIEIERLVKKLENLNIESNASLDSNMLERFSSNIKKFNQFKTRKLEEQYDFWKELNYCFKKLNENYQDYIRNFYTIKADELMKTTEFLIYKENFTEYLRDFIRILQSHSFEIKRELLKIEDADVELLLKNILEYEKTITINLKEFDTELHLKQNLIKWNNIKGWFLNTNEESESLKLLNATQKIIQKITRYAIQLLDKNNNSSFRKEELKHILKLFHSCNSLEEAHKLSSVTIGVEAPVHIRVNRDRETENIYESIYNLKPIIYEIKPSDKRYNRKLLKNPIEIKTKEKENIKKSILKEREEIKKRIEKLIVNNEINFKHMPKYLPQKERDILLRWLSKTKNSNNKTCRNEYGRILYLKNPKEKEKCTIICEDGIFEMPAYILTFKE